MFADQKVERKRHDAAARHEAAASRGLPASERFARSDGLVTSHGASSSTRVARALWNATRWVSARHATAALQGVAAEVTEALQAMVPVEALWSPQPVGTVQDGVAARHAVIAIHGIAATVMEPPQAMESPQTSWSRRRRHGVAARAWSRQKPAAEVMESPQANGSPQAMRHRKPYIRHK